MSTAARVQTELMGELIRGELPPGSFIRQDDTAERLGVSKIPVREALQRLAAVGLLRFEPNRGAVVPQLTIADAHENYALRSAIEPKLLAIAIPQLTIVDLAEAELALNPSDGESPTEANWRFHRALYAASGWQRGVAMVEMLHAAVAPYVLLYTDELGGAVDSDTEHRELLDACRHGDADHAVTLLEHHLDRAEAALVAHFAATSGPTDTEVSP